MDADDADDDVDVLGNIYKLYQAKTFSLLLKIASNEEVLESFLVGKRAYARVQNQGDPH